MDDGWLLIELDNGWKQVVPASDTKPHARVVIEMDGELSGPLADITCPCLPVIDTVNNIIIHNAFDGRQ